MDCTLFGNYRKCAIYRHQCFLHNTTSPQLCRAVISNLFPSDTLYTYIRFCLPKTPEPRHRTMVISQQLSVASIYRIQSLYSQLVCLDNFNSWHVGPELFRLACTYSSHRVGSPQHSTYKNNPLKSREFSITILCLCDSSLPTQQK